MCRRAGVRALSLETEQMLPFAESGDLAPTTRAVPERTKKKRELSLSVQKKKSAEYTDSARDLSICAPSRDYAAIATLRSDLKPTRTSSERSFGCSHAAKCPPLSTLLTNLTNAFDWLPR